MPTIYLGYFKSVLAYDPQFRWKFSWLFSWRAGWQFSRQFFADTVIEAFNIRSSQFDGALPKMVDILVTVLFLAFSDNKLLL